jgi:hypothetical protein
MPRPAPDDSVVPVIARSGATKQSSVGHSRVIIIHSFGHAVAALSAAAESGRAIILASAPGAGIYAGPAWFGALIAAARDAVPAAQSTALLDCGDDAGAAQAALRGGIEGVIFTGRGDVAERLADIAAKRGAGLLTAQPLPTLDLGTGFFASSETLRARCADFLRPD